MHVAAESEAKMPYHWLCVGLSSKAISYYASYFKNVATIGPVELKYLSTRPTKINKGTFLT